MKGWLSAALRVGGVLLAVWLLSRPATQTPAPAPQVIETTNPDLQTVRLFARAESGWTQGGYQAYLNLLLRAGRDAEAVALLNHLTPANADLSALWAIAERQKTAAQWDALTQTLDAILTLTPTDPQANLWLAILSFPQESDALTVAASNSGRGQAQAAAILGITQLEEYSLRDIAILLMEEGEWGFAERLFTLHIADNSLDATAYSYRGYVRDQQGEDGRADFESAIALEPALPLPYFMLGLHERANGDLDASLLAFLSAHALDPDNPALAAEVGAAYQLSEALPDAAAWFDLAAQLAPQDERFAVLQAAFYAENGYQLAESGLEIIENALASFPDNADLLASWGWALAQTGQAAEGETALQRALAFDPDSARVRFYWARFLESQGDAEAADEQYSIVAASQNPYQAAAQARLRR